MRASDLSNDQLIQKLESGKRWLTENVSITSSNPPQNASSNPYNFNEWELNLKIFAQLVDEAQKREIKFSTDWFTPLIFQDRDTGEVPKWLDKPRPTIKSIAESGKCPCPVCSMHDSL